MLAEYCSEASIQYSGYACEIRLNTNGLTASNSELHVVCRVVTLMPSFERFHTYSYCGKWTKLSSTSNQILPLVETHLDTPTSTTSITESFGYHVHTIMAANFGEPTAGGATSNTFGLPATNKIKPLRPSHRRPCHNLVLAACVTDFMFCLCIHR